MIEENETTPAENPPAAQSDEQMETGTRSHHEHSEPPSASVEGDTDAPEQSPDEVITETAKSVSESHSEEEPSKDEATTAAVPDHQSPTVMPIEPQEPAAEATELLPTTILAIAHVSPEGGDPEKVTRPKKPRKDKAPSEEASEEAAAEDTTGSEEPDNAPASAAEAVEAEVVPEPAPLPVPESKKKWYAVKVQSGREESIKAAIERKVKIEGLEEFFGQIVIPVEELIVKKKVKVKNKKTGETTTQEKNVAKYNKKFHGYVFAEVEFNDEILYVFRETSGVGDFVGASLRRAPAPMTDQEVQSMLTGVPDPAAKKKGGRGKVVVKLDFEKGDKVRIRNGAFAGNEGEVKEIKEAKDPTDTPKVTVEVTLWGRPVPVDLDYWEVDKI